MEIDLPAGMHIKQAITEAIQQAAAAQDRVTFRFNGVDVEVQADSDPVAVHACWDRDNTAPSALFTASLEYVKRETEHAYATKKRQVKLNALLGELDAAVGAGWPAALAWLRDFCPLADYREARFPAAYVAWKLSSLAPAHTNEGRADLMDAGNQVEAARWLVGQAVVYLENDKPPHPIIGHKAAELIPAFHG